MSGESIREGVGVGLIGLGTIGTGVARVLRENASVIEERLGFPLRLVRIADLDLDTDRGVDLSGIQFDSDTSGLIADPRVDIVIELIGGYDVPRKFILEAFGAGKHVVTANKALLALHGREIFGAAANAGLDIAFEAAVGGGIPILRSLREGLAANRIETVLGILNGTTNYVLSEMESTGEDFEVVLKRAQELGYAEADPTFDVEGIDAAHKLALLTTMAFGAAIVFEEIPTEGIRGLLPLDFELARDFGYRIKLLGVAKCHPGADGEERIEARVQPTMIPAASLLAKVDGAMNAVEVQGNAVGPTLYYGAGAGEMPTASAVVADLMEIAREIERSGSGPVAPLSYLPEHIVTKPFVPDEELSGRAYLRLMALDRPGVLSLITGALGEEGVGIASVVQRHEDACGTGTVPVIVLTHTASQAALTRALERIEALAEVSEPPRLIRIEEEV
ncbi:MAG: homoserine dehydrogenase [Deltaproteobacteria bacterium]|jgi:homoserine dehydrogenase|nr:homoserine dehydrogenase [Deltaproteobacteria bacterium]MBW2497104.1 homoserine dehydrogenase [Deltaproteobacteria bacterium]